MSNWVVGLFPIYSGVFYELKKTPQFLADSIPGLKHWLSSTKITGVKPVVFSLEGKLFDFSMSLDGFLVAKDVVGNSWLPAVYDKNSPLKTQCVFWDEANSQVYNEPDAEYVTIFNPVIKVCECYSKTFDSKWTKMTKEVVN